MSKLNAYTLALLNEEGHFSCVKSSRSLGYVSYDHLTRCLLKGKFDCFEPLEKLPAGGVLVLDDTVIAKPYSSKIEGVSYLYAPSEQRVVKGLCMVLVLWVYQQRVFVLDVLVWQKGGPTRNDLIRQSLARLRERGLPKPDYVTFDAWYAASETLNLLDSWGWHYMSQVRCNRRFQGKPVKDHLFYGAKGQCGLLRKVNHPVQIFAYKGNYLVTNRLNPMVSRQAWKLYKRRWVIETVFRVLKDELHLQKCSSRSLDAQKHHILACLEAYLFLQEKFQQQSFYAAHQEFLDQHRLLRHRQKTIQSLAA